MNTTPNGDVSAVRFQTASGYMTDSARRKYIASAVEHGTLPTDAHRMPAIVSLDASDNLSQPIQFWQLFSVLGPERIIGIVRQFYQRVFADEDWFRRVFERVGGLEHHVRTQASMWIDVMGGGPAYHGAEFRLHFHHHHNALELLNEKGAARWVGLMVETLDDPALDLGDDPRVRPALNTFLGHFMSQYAADFQFPDTTDFGARNASVKRRINFLNMSSEAIEALPERELIDALEARGIDTAPLKTKRDLVNCALRL